jgi:hypothetical protein
MQLSFFTNPFLTRLIKLNIEDSIGSEANRAMRAMFAENKTSGWPIQAAFWLEWGGFAASACCS